MTVTSQLELMPRAVNEHERTLCQQFSISSEHLCIVYQDAQCALLAISDEVAVTQQQLQWAWQQRFTSRLIIVNLIHRQSSLIDTRAAVTDWLQVILTYALTHNASDIHIEPLLTSVRIRCRLAGQLISLQHLNLDNGNQLTAHIKVLADMDISERYHPQDGRFSIQLKQPLTNNRTAHDFRVSTCAVLTGEKVVIRCLGTLAQITPLSQLGLTSTQHRYVAEALQLSQGLILVTGPTGSGKTSTLYSLLQRLDRHRLNICTVEEPIEIRCHGINQVPVQNQRQLGFAQILRSLLRQDPDVLVVGEIRDSETAQVALQAAQTGHLVMASLHTNGAVASLKRLQALGIVPAEVMSALTLIISQRLLRRYCQQCLGHGCDACHEGYQGQVGCFEVLPWQAANNTPLQTADVRTQLTQLKLPTLTEHAKLLVQQQLTSAAQAQRIQHASA